MGGLSRKHDRELLDALEAHPSEAFCGEVWRITTKGRDPLRSSTAGGRWSPPGEFEVLYTSLAREGAIAENGYRLSLEPVWPSRIEHELHRITARTKKSARFADIGGLSTVGVDIRRHPTFDYSVTQAIAAAAFFLDFDGLIVPSARSAELNLVIFTEKLDLSERLTVEASEPVDWSAWRSRNRTGRPPVRTADAP
jgi:RES domain-containing protein